MSGALVALGMPGFARLAWAQRLAGPEIRIGAILGFSGLFGDWGKKDKVALDLAVEEINAKGGVGGVSIKLFVEDSASKPVEAGILTRKLATDHQVLAIIGPIGSSECEVAFPIANQLKVPIISHASTKPGLGAANRPWAFRMNVAQDVITEPAVRRFAREYNVKSAAIIHDAKDAVAQFVGTRVLPALLKSHGLRIVNEGNYLTFQSRDIDFSAQVTKLKGMQFDGIAFGGFYTDGVTFLKQARRQGVARPMVGGDMLVHELFAQQGGDAVEGTVAAAAFWAGLPDPKVQDLVKKFAAKAEGVGLAPAVEQTTANAYNALYLLAEIIERTGVTNRPEDLSADRERIMRALATTRNWPAVGGQMSFNKDGDAVKNIYVLMVKGGKWVRIE